MNTRLRVLLVLSGVAFTLAGLFAVAMVQPWYHNATPSELEAFLASDTVQLHSYSPDYQCADFSLDMLTRAKQSGLRAHVVEITYNDGSKHDLIAFDVQNVGLVFVEPQIDTMVEVSVGQPYINSSQIIASYEVIPSWLKVVKQ